MKIRLIFLFIFFFMGMFFIKCGDGSDCSGTEVPYFDAVGFQVNNLIDPDFGIYAEAGDTISISQFIAFEVDYYRIFYGAIQQQMNDSWNFYPALYGCSPSSPGDWGSKTDQIKKIEVTTLYDYSETYPAGTVINEILNYFSKHHDMISLNNYVARKGYAESVIFRLLPQEKPLIESLKEMQVKIIIEFENGEKYVERSPLIYIKE